MSKELRISTMTIVGKMHHDFELKELFSKLEPDNNIKYIEHGENNKGENYKLKNKKKKSKKQVKKKYFYNQISLHILSNKIINLKIFNNGSVQMTGITNNRMIDEIVNILETKMNSIHDNSTFHIKDIRIVMLNSDFNYGYSIDNNKLHEIVEKNNYYSSYEPCSYPGVNIKYYYNKKENNYGICQCMNDCDGKGKNGNCKRITIAVFKSGNIIITGGSSYEHLYIAKDFITDMIYNNKEHILLEYGKYVTMIQRNYRIYRNKKNK